MWVIHKRRHHLAGAGFDCVLASVVFEALGQRYGLVLLPGTLRRRQAWVHEGSGGLCRVHAPGLPGFGIAQDGQEVFEWRQARGGSLIGYLARFLGRRPRFWP
jgi:hypothetical protein